MSANRLLVAVALLLVASVTGVAVGEEKLTLDHGGAVVGSIVRDAGTPRSQLVVESAWGPVTLQRSRVDRVVPISPAKAEYLRRAPTVSDTADAQFALARWCRDNGLSDELRRHLRRVLVFDPDHAEARKLLGYQQLAGQWVTREDLLAARGLIRHDGEYRTRQEVALLTQAERTEQTRRDWGDRLQAWRDDLLGSDQARARAAEEALANLDAVEASEPLGKLLLTEEQPVARLALIDAAARLDTPTTVRSLARIALNCPDAEARATALETLTASKRQGLTAPFIAALRSPDNTLVNRAADGLASLGDTRTLAPLIESLTTTHRRRVGADTQGDTFSFNANAGQFAFGGGGARIVSRELRNPNVHRALVGMTGVNFLYDKPRWRDWLAEQEAASPVDLRRDS